MNEAEVSWEVRARRAEAHLAALDVAVQGISGVLALEAVLDLIVDRVRDLANAEYAALGIARPDGVIQRFMTPNMTSRRYSSSMTSAAQLSSGGSMRSSTAVPAGSLEQPRSRWRSSSAASR